jgi:hypothetical protein
MKFRFVIASLLAILLIISLSFAGVSNIKGYMFGDYFYNIANDDKSEENYNGFQFRRIYFTFENNLNDDIKVRLRLEAETGKTTSSGLISPFVKDAYLEWANLLPYHKAVIGLASPPTWELSEAIWGYRSIEKTIMDLNKIRSSREMGVGLKGALDMNSRVNHHFMIGNGEGYKGAENDKYKLFMYSLWFVPTEGLTLQVYADYQRLDNERFLNPSTADTSFVKVNDMVFKGFIAYETPQFTIGVEGFQHIKKNDVNDSQKMGLSLFGSAIPKPGTKFKVFGRFDYWDPDTDSDNNEESLLIGGLDFIPAGNVHILPNVLIRSYAEDGKDRDVTARVTFLYKWSSEKF